MPAAADPQLARDTDADWRILGETEPYWSVLGLEGTRTAELRAEAVERFYAVGREEIGFFRHLIERACGRAPAGGRGLDFGCGVGRLSEAMADVMDEVVGVDVSPGMLRLARERSGRVTYLDEIPASGRFDWINSHIVLQHIPPPRGLAILDRLLGLLAPDGAVSIQLPFFRAPEQRPRPGVEVHIPAGEITMFDYDLNAVFEVLWTHRVRRHLLWPTDHGGVYGFIIAARREPDA